MRKWGFFVVILLLWGSSAKGLDLKTLQDSLHKLGDPWVAGSTSVSHLTIEEKRKLCGFIPPTTILKNAKIKTGKLSRKVKTPPPATWDWRDKDGKNWTTPVKAQLLCGACWAFAMCSAMEARIKIVDNTPDATPDLSEQFLISCNSYGDGCNEGGSFRSFWDVKRDGIPDEACFPYAASEVSCSNRCDGWEDRAVKITAYRENFIPDTTDAQKKEWIMEGPISVAVTMKEDFFYYKRGVYEPIMGKETNHAICCIGWTASGGWICKNSWGSSASWPILSKIESPCWCIPEGLNPCVLVDKVEFNEPNDGIWDQGESVDIIVTLKGKRDGFANVVGVLSTTDTDINITAHTSNFGSIPKNGTADNSTSPYKATADVSTTEHDVVFKLCVTADGGYSDTFEFKIAVGTARFNYVNVQAGNAILTVTSAASIGYEEPDVNGSGFIYPASGNNTLLFGSMAFGNSSSYLVDDWYIGGYGDKDWNTITSPDGRLKWISPPTRGDTITVGYYDDSGISGAKGIVCKQEAWAFKNPEYDDFVIICFTYTNEGSSSLADLYSAVFMDFEIGNPNTNNADINESKYLSWVSGGSVYGGITLLDPLDKFANASTIKNVTYVHPTGGMTDANQFEFMNGAHHYGFQASEDYSAMVSAGPFDLDPDASQIVAFAIIGGGSKSEIEAHADSARSAYKQAGVEEKEVRAISKDITLEAMSNPVLNISTTAFSLSKVSDVTINIYDIAGKLVYCLVDNKRFQPGSHTVTWNGNDRSGKEVPYGIYFLRLKSNRSTCVKKVILLK